MRKASPINVVRLIALALAVALFLPNPAFALRTEARSEAKGGLEELEQALQPIISAFSIPKVAPATGLEEIRSVLIAGSDADEIARVWVIVSEELVGVDIRTLELPIETGASFQGADLAIATEPNLAEHELEILGRFPKGLIAPDPQETRLDEEELRQALRDLRDAGLEEGEVVIDQHQKPILAVAISPDGRTIASGDETGRLVIKPVEGGVPLQVQTGPDPIVDLMFDPKGQMVAVGDLKGQIAFYDSQTGQPFGLEDGLGRPIKLGRIVWSLAFHQDGHVAVIDDGARIHSVEVKTEDVRRLFGGLDLGLPAGHIARVAVARLEESLHHRFALGSGNTVVVVEDGPNPAVADRFEIGDNQVIQALAMDHSGRYVVVSNIDDTDSGNRIFFRDIGEKTTIELKGPHSQRAQAMAFSPDGAVLASAGKDGNLVFWKVPSGQVIGEINRGTPGERGSPILLHDVVFAPNGQFVLVSVEDRTGETKKNTVQRFSVPAAAGLEEGDNSKDRFKSSNIAFDRLMAQAREQGIEAFEIYEGPDESRPATLAPKVPGSPLTDPDASLGLEREMRRIFGDEVDRQTYYLRIGAKEGWDGLWAEVVANAGQEENAVVQRFADELRTVRQGKWSPLVDFLSTERLLSSLRIERQHRFLETQWGQWILEVNKTDGSPYALSDGKLFLEDVMRAVRNAQTTGLTDIAGQEEAGNEILRILRNELQVDQLTLPTLQQAIKETFNALPDSEKRRINRAIALAVLQSLPASSRGESVAWGGSSLLKNARVAGANHSGPFDVTLRWKSGTDGNPPVLESATLDSGGGQVNVAKLFANFGQPFGLTALSGSPDGQIDTQWRNGIASPYVTAQFIPTGTQDKRVNVNHILDGVPLHLMVGWGDPIPQTVFDRINADSLEMLSQMTEGNPDRVWFHITAGGGIRYDASFSPYGSLSRAIKDRFGARVQLVIDAKFTSTPEELQSVLNVPRPVPQDIFTPNVEELVLALRSTGDPRYAGLQAQALSEEQIERFALELLRKYNLLGILVTRDKEGLKLVLADQIIDEKGILVEQKSPLGAGDATKAVFSLALSQGVSWETAVHQANMAGAATVMLDGTRVATSQSLKEVERLAKQQRVAPVIKFTAGLEEALKVFRQWMEDEDWESHFSEPGFVALDTERKAAMDIPAEATAFIVADDAAVSTDGHRIYADDRLTHPDRQYLIWTPSGTGAQEVVQSARQRGAKQGDLLLIPPDTGITIDRVEALLREVGYALDLSDAPRVVIAGQSQVEATALSTLWFLASHPELPRVVFLNVEMKLTDEAGSSYTLIVMA